MFSLFAVIKHILSGKGIPKKNPDVNEDKRKEETKYGGCEGPDAMYVKLISSDGHEFIVRRDHAMQVFGTIRAMLSGPVPYEENETNEIHFEEIPSHILQKICMYIAYKVKYTNSSTKVPAFPIDPKIALDVLMASLFLTRCHNTS